MSLADKLVRKVYLGWFVCDTCGQRLDKHPFTIDDMSIYCDCGTEDSMRIADVKLKVPVVYLDLQGNQIN